MIRRLIAPLLSCVATLGCAEERPPISRVQPHALAKSFFVGRDLAGTQDDPEFYKRGTIVDVGYGAGQEGLFTSTYAQPVSRIRWEITERTLNARLSYERVTGTDGKGEPLDGVAYKPTNDGQIVASYAVESHFDIRREYNPQTGEELNIVAENTQDRTWSGRKYFRVNWAQNLVTDSYDFDTLSLLGVLGGVDYDPIAYTVLDPDDPDAPHFDVDDGYFAVTNKVYATPKRVDISSLGVGFDELPACLLSSNFSGGTDPWGNCNPIEITLRESYRRITDTDYEPMDHDGVRFRVLGAFNFNYRRGYDRHYGMLDAQWNRFISRYNIWERSHYYDDPKSMSGFVPCATTETTEDPTGDPNADPNRDDDGDGTADECETAGSGSRCDVYKRRCTLPYRERSVVTQPWYVAGDTSLFEPTNWAVQEWDLALKTAVQTARLVECRRTGGSNCDADYPMWRGQQDDNDEAIRISHDLQVCQRELGWEARECADRARAAARDLARARGDENDASTLAIAEVALMPPVLILCNNPVTRGDHPACGRPGLAPRLGDIRYHLVLNIADPQVPSPWGILADGDDPITGEKVAGSMNIWTHVTDMAAQQLVDLVRYANGELSTDEITNGKYVRDWAGAARLGSSGSFPTLSKAELDARIAAATHADPELVAQITKRDLPGELRAVLHAGKLRALDVEARTDVASPGLAKVQATLKTARGTPVESALLNPAMLALSGVPNSGSADATLSHASPLALNSPLLRNRLRELRENALARRGACVLDEAPEPSAMTGLADILRDKFPAAEGETESQRNGRYRRMLNYVKRRFHYAVIAHEMGHSVGLRHNFVSSAAPLFYRPQYWQLRTRNGAVTAPCSGAMEDGTECVGPRYWDPVTDEERSQLITMWMQSTVMDYPGDVSQNMLGLGIADFAATRFFYGDTVSVYSDADYRAGTRIGTGITLATDTFGGLLGIRYGLRGDTGQGSDDFHYSALQRNYGVIRDCYATEPVPPANWSDEKDGFWNPVLDGHVVWIDGRQTKCRQTPVDYLGFGELRMPADSELNGGFYRGGPNVEPSTGRLRVPYAFASDNWADLGNVSVLRHDNGADPYEQVQFLITTQEVRHIIDNYRRGRTTFSVRGAVDRSFGRYNSKLQGIAGGMGFFASIYNDIGLESGYDFKTLWPYVVNLTARDNMIASTVAFDHFTRQLTRPEPGEHYRRTAAWDDPVFRSASDPDELYQRADNQPLELVVPNGATGYLRDVGFGGHLLANSLSSRNGDFDVEFIENAGSYYDKINTAWLLAESEDRFVSQSRRDFYDARFRAVGLADVFPDGFRRTLANALTGDRSLLAPRVETDDAGMPILDASRNDGRDPLAPYYPARPLGWVSLWPAKGPEICFSRHGRSACTDYTRTTGFGADMPAFSAPVDPQIGWEVQKFFIAWTIALIKANEKTAWLDMMRLYRLGANSNPEFEDRMEWQDPVSGELYYARTFGTECLFGVVEDDCAGGRVVQRGIAARVLEYANELTSKGYELDLEGYPEAPTHPAGFNRFGRAMVARHPNGVAIVKADPAIRKISGLGMLVPVTPCDQNVDPACTPLTADQNHHAHQLEAYKSVPDFLWQAGVVYGLFGPPGPRGIY